MLFAACKHLAATCFVGFLLTATRSLAAQQIGFVDHPVTSINSQPIGITTGSDGALWFVDFNTDKIGRMTTAGAITEYAIPTRNSMPFAITSGPDGALWFVETADSANKIGRITTAGVITEFPIPTPNALPSGIAAGSDGALWFTEFSANAIGRITTTGAITEYPAPRSKNNNESAPDQITAGPDGALWFTAIQGGYIGRITTAGVFTTFDVPAGGGAPLGITTGPDNAVWFTEDEPAQIGRLTTTGVFSQYPLALITSLPEQIITGSDGALWFTDSTNQEIGRITTAGAITEYPLPPEDATPEGITLGPDARIWFTENLSARVGQVAGTLATLTSSPNSGHPGTKATIAGSGFGANERLNLYWDSISGNMLNTINADSSGSFTVTEPAEVAPNGDSSFVAVGQTSGNIGIANFDVTAVLVPTPTKGAPGASIAVDGFGFGAGDTVSCYWDRSDNALASSKTNARGSFALTFSIPMNSPVGANSLICGQNNVVRAGTTITVE